MIIFPLKQDKKTTASELTKSVGAIRDLKVATLHLVGSIFSVKTNLSLLSFQLKAFIKSL